MAEAVVSFALEEIRYLRVEEGKLLCGVGDEVKELETQLKEMKNLLEDADKTRHETKIVAHHIATIRDLAYRAEEAIEMHSARAFSGRTRNLRRLLRRYCCILKECYSVHHLGKEISGIKSELAAVKKEMREEGITRNSTSPGGDDDDQSWALSRRTFPDFEVGDIFVGKEEELEDLVSRVVADEREGGGRVISVWGMGGIGKTTIVKRAFNHLMGAKKGRFESFAWVCITQQCQIRSVFEEVLTQLTTQRKKEVMRLGSTKMSAPQGGEELSTVSVAGLIDRLCNVQRSKRCLIVLDDVWEISQWEGLKHAFNVHDLKSRILITTRKRNVAHVGDPVELGFLNEEDAWELLKRKAFPNGKNPDFTFEEKLLEKTGKEMVEKCGCLPLAVCLLGGVMRKKISMEEWELANENMHEFIYRGEGLDVINNKLDGVLNLSYENLPYYLKPCFLCLSMFNEDEFIDADILYGMWISQGMISSEHIRANNGETLMDIAELYLSELVARSLVRVNINDILPRRKYLSCEVHDVVRELCLKLGKKEDFGVQILDYEGGKLSTLIRKALFRTKTRHLSIEVLKDLELKDEGITINGKEDIGRYLRTFRIYSQVDLESDLIEFPPKSIVDFNKFKLLRELSILRFKFTGGKLPRGITHLFHLRCLRLQHCKLDKLPSSIMNLLYLDTLDLLGSTNVQVPNVLKKLVRLRELIFPDYDEEAIGKYRLRLEEDAFDHLESLMGFNSSVHELKSFKIMKSLRNFLARIDNNESLLAVVNTIATKGKRLHICVVEIKDGCQLTNEDELTKKLFTCPYLHVLRIGIRLGKLPTISNLVSSVLFEVCLLGSEIEDDPMEVLGKLPCLVVLNLLSRSFIGEKMSCPASSFPRLECLVLDDLPKLRDWIVEHGSMPLLCEVAILRCSRLEMVPDGFSYISTLKSLMISEMPDLGKRVSPSGEDFHKISHVPSINIHH